MTENLLKKTKKRKGFTLIELIVVIAIIAIISLIAIPKVMGYQNDAKHKADISNAKTISNATATLITNSDITLPTTGNTYDIPVQAITLSSTPTNAQKAQDVIVKALQTVPTIQTGNSSAVFHVNIDSDGNVIIYDAGGTASTNQIYPKPATTTNNPYYD